MTSQLSWRNISVVKAVGLAVLIIICGYTASLFTMVQAIHTLRPLVYDQEVEDTLTRSLHLIKNQDQLQRDLLLHLLRDEYSHRQRVTEEEVKAFLAKADLTDSSLLGIISVSDSRSSEGIFWQDRTHLALHNLIITLPQEPVRKRFDEVNLLRQRYQLIRGTWDDQIGPTFIALHGVILLATFAILGGALFVLVQRYQHRIKALVGGFGKWSEADSQFRFKSENFKDELLVITTQFNIMADEVEANRRRTLYLEKMSSWQTMARKMAHEIKNPLTPIKMMVSHLVRKYEGGDEAYQKILEDSQQIIVEEVNSLRRMVDSFSKFAQLPEPKLEDHDLVQLCRHVYEMQKAAFAQHEFLFEADQATATAFVDPQLLRQVIINISKNAAEASDQCRIAIKLKTTEKHYEIHIIDNGPGIPPEILPRIFEAYFTTKHTGDSPGMGLGLAICKKIVLDHGGELIVSSQPGDTQFTLSIPKKSPL